MVVGGSGGILEGYFLCSGYLERQDGNSEKDQREVEIGLMQARVLAYA